MDSRRSVVSALAVHGDRILGVGTKEELEPFISPDTKRIDLAGKTMMPGFYDCHSHFIRAGMYYGLYLNAFARPLGDLQNLDELAARIKEKAAATPKGEWILCAGYDDTALADRRHFTLAELDAMAPDHPLFLRHISGHSALCNSMALKTCGIGPKSVAPAGGLFKLDGDGNLTGLVEEPAAMDYVLKFAPQMTPELWLKSAEAASSAYLKKGVATAHEGGVTTEIWNNYFNAHAAVIIKNRIQLLPRHGSFDFSLIKGPHEPGRWLTDDGKLVLGPVKLFQDGSIQGYTGYLCNPYHEVLDTNLPEYWRGYPIHTPTDLAAIVKKYHLDGWQIAIHANGDNAIDDVLDAYESALRAWPDHQRRHIVIHAQTARDDQIARMARLGVIPSFFVVHTYYWGDRHAGIFLGPERAARISPLASALRAGIPFTNHNDTAVTPIDPLLSVWSAVNRITSCGQVLGPQQRIPVWDALCSITIWGAVQFHEEKIKGSLEPGKLADMTILAENPLSVPSEHIRDIQVSGVIVANDLVYGEY